MHLYFRRGSGNQLGQIVTVDSTDVDVLGSVALLHVQESEEQAVEVQSETEEDVHLTGEYDEEYQETETEPEPEQEAEGADNRSADASGKVTPDRQRPRSFFRHATFPAPGVVDWVGDSTVKSVIILASSVSLPTTLYRRTSLRENRAPC